MKYNRRNALKVLAGMTALFGARAIKRLIEPPLNALGNYADYPYLNYLPSVNKPLPSMQGKVIHIQNNHATTWQGQTAYWEYVDQCEINDMVDQGVMYLTGASTLSDAWRAILPSYLPGEKIAIKVNFNNNHVCSPTSGVIDALIQPVNAVVRGLEMIGVNRADVCVYDAIRALPDRFTQNALSGVSFYDGSYTGICNTPAGFTAQTDHYVVFNPPSGVHISRETVSDVLFNTKYLINIPIMKGGHPIAGVTLGFKNHFGSVNNPSGMHDHVDVVNKPSAYRTDYNPLVDLMASPILGGKTVLTIGDAIYGAKDFNDTPEIWSTFGDQAPGSLFFSIDPVAIDCVMHDHIAAELESKVAAGSNNYLILAANAGLGVFESKNPWTQSYTQINYEKFTL
ncbi:MAG: DUF362 domain-containing protein [Anaerolineales bacterium]|nr:DUF362 domain-containing protein [Anaerolineales bacterium]